jgi:AraC-like DNA-binding protein
MQKNYKRSAIAAVAAVKKHIDSLPVNGKSTSALALQYGISRNALQEIFKAKHKISIGHYRLKLRMAEARKLLLGTRSIKEISFSLDYASHSSFTNSFRKFYQVSPAEWRRRNKATNANKQVKL